MVGWMMLLSVLRPPLTDHAVAVHRRRLLQRQEVDVFPRPRQMQLICV